MLVLIEMRNGQLILLEYCNAPLPEAMHETCKLAGLATFQAGRSGEPPPANAAIDKLAPCEAMKRLVGAENQILIYAGLASMGFFIARLSGSGCTRK